MAITRQWHCKHVSAATNTPATIELWQAVFSVGSVPRNHYQTASEDITD
jgi:hypothetical protein